MEIDFHTLNRDGKAHKVRVRITGETAENAEIGTFPHRVMNGMAVVHPDCRRAAFKPVQQLALPLKIDMIVVEGDPFAVPVALIAARFRMHST